MQSGMLKQIIIYHLYNYKLSILYFIRDSIAEIQSTNCHLLRNENDLYDHHQHHLHYSISPEQSQESASIYLGLPVVCIENLEEIKLKITSSLNSHREIYASIILDQVC